jgi:hypothetical protein
MLLLLLVLLFLLSWVFWAAYNNPGLPVPKTPKWSLVIVGGGFAVLFGLNFSPYLGIGILAVALLPLLYLESKAATAMRKASAKVSKLTTAYLQLSLHHQSGAIECTVSSGKHAGNVVRSLPQAQLAELIGECEANDPLSAALIDCFLARIRRNPWHEKRISAGATFPIAGCGEVLSRVKALELLGLEFDHSQEQLTRTHEKLRSKFKPEYDGFDFLMSKIDEAKAVLQSPTTL